jgi:hypothetical protein
MDEGERSKGSWWHTIPGVLTATAGIITAVTGLIVALHQAGLFSATDNQTSDPKVEPRSESTISVPTLPQGALQKKEEETTAPPAEPKPELAAGALFQDDFERDQLGKLYEILNPDPNRLAVAEGQLLIVAGPNDQGEVPKNLVLVRQKFSGDFTATIRLTMQVTQGNSVSVRYWVDSKNELILGIHGFQATGSDKSEGRHIGFTKILNDKPNYIWQFYSEPRWSYLGSLGGRQLLGVCRTCFGTR